MLVERTAKLAKVPPLEIVVPVQASVAQALTSVVPVAKPHQGLALPLTTSRLMDPAERTGRRAKALRLEIAVPAQASAVPVPTSVEQAAKHLLAHALLQTTFRRMEAAGRTGRLVRGRHLVTVAPALASVELVTLSVDLAARLHQAHVMPLLIFPPMVHVARMARHAKARPLATAAQVPAFVAAQMLSVELAVKLLQEHVAPALFRLMVSAERMGKRAKDHLLETVARVL